MRQLFKHTHVHTLALTLIVHIRFVLFDLLLHFDEFHSVLGVDVVASTFHINKYTLFSGIFLILKHFEIKLHAH